jgi:glycosyltransferase involved in cell wall biosynthesis
LKILLYTDLAIRPYQLFWHRDLGLLTKAFRDLGHDALLVVHPAGDTLSNIKNPKFHRASGNPIHHGMTTENGQGRFLRGQSYIQNDPVLWVSQEDICNPLWWKDHQPDLVILGLWTRPKYDPIRRAALSATPHVIERADSDGMRTASCGLLTYAKRRFDYFRDRTFRWPSLLSIPASIFYSFTSILATPWIEYRLRKTLRLLPSILVETPHATNLWKFLATRLRADPKKIHCVPHPFQTDIFKLDPTIQKKNQIISVGRWESYQKNLPLLLKTLLSFLDKNPSWTSLVIGSGLPTRSPHPRITFLSPQSPPDLARRMQESKIFFSSSRYESFGLASAEAEACGCLVVGPFEIPMLNHDSVSKNNSFLGSTFSLLLGKLQIASERGHPPSSQMKAAHISSPQFIASLLLRLPVFST